MEEDTYYVWRNPHFARESCICNEGNPLFARKSGICIGFFVLFIYGSEPHSFPASEHTLGVNVESE